MSQGYATPARRRLIAAICALALPLPSLAQAQPPRVTWINAGGDPRRRAIRDHLKAAGLVDGRDMALHFEQVKEPDAGFVDRIRAARPAVIVSFFDEAFALLSERVRDIPIVVYHLGTDPVALGLVQSLRRPGGNITGTMIDLQGVARKNVELMKELAPGARRFAALMGKEAYEQQILHPERLHPLLAASIKLVQENDKVIHAALGVEVVQLAVPKDASADELEALIRKADVQGLYLHVRFTPELRAVTRKARLPTMAYSFRSARNGVLLGHSFDWDEGESHAASIVARILRGENPAVIPVYILKNFGYALNRTTARESGIDIPPSVLLRAMEVYDD
jgi:putative ABC transport system substrate-binding protein